MNAVYACSKGRAGGETFPGVVRVLDTAGRDEHEAVPRSGQVELRVGQHAEVLAQGDSAAFAGDLAHKYTNVGSAQMARFALTVFEPSVGGAADDDSVDHGCSE